MTYVAMAASGVILAAFGLGTLYFWGLANARFGKAGGIPAWDPVAAAQGAFAGILDYPMMLAIVSDLYWAWIYAILALCCAIMTVLGVRRAWLRFRDIAAA